MITPRPGRSLQLCAAALAAACLLTLGGAAPAAAAEHGRMLATSASIFSPITSVFHAITGAALGAFSWTISLATKFILVTLAALVRMLIPRSWAKEGVQVFQWIVAIPNFAGQVTSPGGGHSYGFAGVNDMRQLLEWIGLGLLPLTLVYATGRAMIGAGDHVAAPVARVVVLALLLASYTFWWAQGAALVNQLTSLILSPAAVTDGIHKLMAYATEGVGLGGWQLIDLSLMAALALELLGLIFVKVVVILVGAILYAAGPLMIGIVPTDQGSGLARAWLTATLTLLVLPVAWAIVFAVGAVLVGDASTAGPLIGGNSDVGQLLGGVIVAVAGTATLWLCLKAAKEIGGILRLQLGTILAVRHRGRQTTAPATPAPRAGQAASSIRAFQGRVRDAGHAALRAGGGPGIAVSNSLSAAARVGQRGLISSGAQLTGSATVAGGRAAARSRMAQAARPQLAAAAASAAIGSPAAVQVGRAGAVASRMARAGTASWRHARNTSASTSGTQRSRPSGKVSRWLPEPEFRSAKARIDAGSAQRREAFEASELARPAAGAAQRRAQFDVSEGRRISQEWSTARSRPGGESQTAARSPSSNGASQPDRSFSHQHPGSARQVQHVPRSSTLPPAGVRPARKQPTAHGDQRTESRPPAGTQSPAPQSGSSGQTRKPSPGRAPTATPNHREEDR